MKRRKTTPKKSRPRRKATAATAARRRRKTGARKPAAKKRAPARRARKAIRRKPAAKKRTAAARRKGPRRGLPERLSSIERPQARIVEGWQRGLGGEAAGQSGDLEGIPRAEDVDSESVEELLEEGQSWEAGIVSGVENADDKEGEVTTREVPEDDVPEEYRDEDELPPAR